jgi:hypothetical protein
MPTTETGRQAYADVHDIASKYTALDIVQVQEACEAERTRRLSIWRTTLTPYFLHRLPWAT